MANSKTYVAGGFGIGVSVAVPGRKLPPGVRLEAEVEDHEVVGVRAEALHRLLARLDGVHGEPGVADARSGLAARPEPEH